MNMDGVLRTAERLERYKKKQAIWVVASRNSTAANDSVGRLFRIFCYFGVFLFGRAYSQLYGFYDSNVANFGSGQWQ